MATAAGENRKAFVVQGALRLTDEGLAEFQRVIQDLHERYGAGDADGTRSRVLIAAIDLEERPRPPASDVRRDTSKGAD